MKKVIIIVVSVGIVCVALGILVGNMIMPKLYNMEFQTPVVFVPVTTASETVLTENIITEDIISEDVISEDIISEDIISEEFH